MLTSEKILATPLGFIIKIQTQIDVSTISHCLFQDGVHYTSIDTWQETEQRGCDLEASVAVNKSRVPAVYVDIQHRCSYQLTVLVS